MELQSWTNSYMLACFVRQHSMMFFACKHLKNALSKIGSGLNRRIVYVKQSLISSSSHTTRKRTMHSFSCLLYTCTRTQLANQIQLNAHAGLNCTATYTCMQYMHAILEDTHISRRSVEKNVGNAILRLCFSLFTAFAPHCECRIFFRARENARKQQAAIERQIDINLKDTD